MVRASWALVMVLLGSAPLLSQEKYKDRKPAGDKAPARLTILLPADAKLIIDEVLTKSTGPKRLFTTPPLTKGTTCEYTLEWTYTEGGVNITRMAVVAFQGGMQEVFDLRPGSKTVISSRSVYVPTAQNIVDKMLEMAKITAKDVVYDLGCGDGRIFVTAAKKFGAKGVGIDIDPERVKDSLANIAKAKVETLV